MTLFFALCFVGVAVAGLTALLIFWPLTLVHLRDRHPDALDSFGEPAFISPTAWRWLLARRYRSYRDSALSGLATPAWLSLLTIFSAWAWRPCSGCFQGTGMNIIDIDAAHSSGSHDQWWLATIGRTLIWARLRIKEAGTAEVMDSDGKTLAYDSEDTARAALFDAEFVALDGLDEEDALMRGFSLHEVSPPRGDSDADLRERMVVTMGGRA